MHGATIKIVTTWQIKKNRVYCTFYSTTYITTLQKATVLEQVTQLSS